MARQIISRAKPVPVYWAALVRYRLAFDAARLEGPLVYSPRIARSGEDMLVVRNRAGLVLRQFRTRIAIDQVGSPASQTRPHDVHIQHMAYALLRAI